MSIFTVNGKPVKYGNQWLANGGTPSSELPPYDSSDAGKALVVNNEGDNVEWQIVGSSGVVDQNYDPTSSNAQSGTAVAEALQTVETLPSSSSSDVNKVLTVNNQGEPEWMSAQGGSDIFIADSTTTSEEMYQAYLAGKVLFYKDSTYGMFNVFCKTYSGECNFKGYQASTTNSDLRYGNFVTAFLKKETISNGHVFPQSNIFGYNLSFHETRVLDTPALPGNAGKILAVNGTATAVEWVAAPTDTTYSAGTGLSLNGTTFSVDDPLPSHTSSDEGKILKVDSNGDLEWGAESGGTVTDVQVNGTSVVSGGVANITVPAAVTVDQHYSSSSTNPQSGIAVAEAIGGVSQVPSSTSADENKVLTVNSSGVAEWATAQGGTTYTAGNMISLANNAVAVSTTAGVTDIQFVNALPANPVATVLYLIPAV